MTGWRQKLQRALTGHVTETRTVRGIEIVVVNTRADIDTDHVFARLDAALELIARYQPWHFRRLARDIERIVVQRYPCRGAYFPGQHTCLIELTFAVNPSFTVSQVAATLLHEAMHARLDRAGVRHDAVSAAKHERFCRRAEIELGLAVPDGAAIVERARATLGAPDEDVAPVIDWDLARRRIEEADRAAAGRAGAP